MNIIAASRAQNRRERNSLRNLDIREERRNLKVNGDEEIENSFYLELRS